MAKKVAEIEASVLLNIEGTEDVKRQLKSINESVQSVKDGTNIKYKIYVDKKDLVKVQELQKNLQSQGKDLLKIGVDKSYIKKAFVGIKDIGDTEIEQIQKFFEHALSNIGNDEFQKTTYNVIELISNIRELQKEIKKLKQNNVEVQTENKLKEAARGFYQNKDDVNKQRDLVRAWEAFSKANDFDYDVNAKKAFKENELSDIIDAEGKKIKIKGEELIRDINKLASEWRSAVGKTTVNNELESAVDEMWENNDKYLDDLDSKNKQLKAYAVERKKLYEQIINTEIPQRTDEIPNQLGGSQFKTDLNSLKNFEAEINRIKQKLQNLGEIPIKITPANIGDFIEKIEKHKAHIELDISNINEVIDNLNTVRYRGVYEEVYNEIQGRDPRGKKIRGKSAYSQNQIEDRLLNIFNKNPGTTFNPSELAEIGALLKSQTELNQKLSNSKNLSEKENQKLSSLDIHQDKLQELGYNVDQFNKDLIDLMGKMGFTVKTTFSVVQRQKKDLEILEAREKHARYNNINKTFVENSAQGNSFDDVLSKVTMLLNTFKASDKTEMTSVQTQQLIGLTRALEKISGKKIDLDSIIKKTLGDNRALKDIAPLFEQLDLEYIEEAKAVAAHRQEIKRKYAEKHKNTLVDAENQNGENGEDVEIEAKLASSQESIKLLKEQIENGINPIDVKLSDNVNTEGLTKAIEGAVSNSNLGSILSNTLSTPDNSEEVYNELFNQYLKVSAIREQIAKSDGGFGKDVSKTKEYNTLLSETASLYDKLEAYTGNKLSKKNKDGFMKSLVDGTSMDYLSKLTSKNSEQKQNIISVDLNPNITKLQNDINKTKLKPIPVDLEPNVKEFKSKIKLIKPEPVDIKINADNAHYIENINRVVNNNDLNNVNVKLTASVKDIKAQVAKIKFNQLLVPLKVNAKDLKAKVASIKLSPLEVAIKPNTKLLKDKLKDTNLKSIEVDIKPNINGLKTKLKQINNLSVSVELKSSIKSLQLMLKEAKTDSVVPVALKPDIKGLSGALANLDPIPFVRVNLVPNIKRLKTELKNVKDLDITVKDKTTKKKSKKDEESEKNPQKKSTKSYNITAQKQYGLEKKVENTLKSIDIDNLLDKKFDLIDKEDIGDAKSFKEQVEAIAYKVVELVDNLNSTFDSRDAADKAIVDLEKRLDLLKEISSVKNQLNTDKVNTLGTIKDSTTGKSKDELQHIIEEQLKDQYDSIDFSNFNVGAKSFDIEFVKDDILHEATVQLKDYTNAAGEAAMAIQMLNEKTNEIKKEQFEVSLKSQHQYDNRVKDVLAKLDSDNLLDKKINFIDESDIKNAESFKMQIFDIAEKINELNQRLKGSFNSKDERDQAVVDLERYLDLAKEIASIDNQLNTKNKTHISEFAIPSNNISEKELSRQIEKLLRKQYESVQLGEYDKINKSFQVRLMDSGQITEGVIKLTEYTNALNEAAVSVDLFNAKTKESTGFVSSWFKGLKTKIASLTQYVSGMDILLRIINEIRGGFQFVKELDSAMTTVYQTMDITRQGLDELSSSAIKQAKALGAVSEQVVDAIGIYAAYGETVDSILSKTKPTTMLANAAGIDAKTASDQIQGVWIKPMHIVIYV